MLRQFQSASGRTWCVQLATANNLDRGAPGHDVLQFHSPGLSCELKDWPADWENCPEPKLTALLDRALSEWLLRNTSRS